MLIDNIVVNSLKKEFNSLAVNSKIEKIYQFEIDFFVIDIWNKKENFSLAISLNANTYRTCLTKNKYKNNKISSPFLIQLKKYFEYGYIVRVEQINFDRILLFEIESTNDIKDKVTYFLIVEMTGKYSNLILTDKDYKVLGSFRYIGEEKNEERQILLDKKYYPITNKQNKIKVTKNDYELFNELLSKNLDKKVKSFLTSNFLYLSSHTTEFILQEFSESIIKDLNNNQIKLVFSELIAFYENLEKDNIFIELVEKDNKLLFDLNYGEKIPSISFDIDTYFYKKLLQTSFDRLKRELKTIVDKNLAKISDKINEFRINTKDLPEADKYKQYGELIFSNLYQLPENTNQVILENYYDDNNLLTIELDENITVSENAQKLLKKYTKLKSTYEHNLKLIENLELELSYFENVSLFLDNSEKIEDLKEIEQELALEKYISKKGEVQRSKTKEQLVKESLLNFTTSDGFEILIGKNNVQNEFLTTKFANVNDLWFHARLIPGSHVILKTDNGKKTVTQKALTEAAMLAAKYSKARYSSNVCIIYTKIKYVKKPPQTKPGFVTYSKERAIYVTPDI